MTITDEPDTRTPDEVPPAPGAPATEVITRVLSTARDRGRALGTAAAARAKALVPPARRSGPPSAGRAPLPPATPTQRIVQTSLWMLSAVLIGIVLNLTVFSHLQYQISQQQDYGTLRQQLAEATVPVSEVTVDNQLVQDGDPVALIEIPTIDLRAVIVEGTTSGALMEGPGHRRDTVLPGQSGVSVILGRAGAYGGPFSRIEELAPGDTFVVTTGQGEHLYRVLGVRYAGDPGPPAPESDESRLVLTTARGFPYLPTGVVRVDAELTSTIQDTGVRVTVPASLPRAAMPMEGDTSTVWALVLWLQAALIVELAAVWALKNWGRRETWLVFVPVGLAVGLQVADQITRLLPNLL